MNYQLTVEDEGYFADTERLLTALPLHGSGFKKPYRDHLRGINVSRYVEAEDLIVPYTATSLEDAPRITHRIYMHGNDLRKLQVKGVSRDVTIPRPTVDVRAENESIREIRDEAEDRTPSLLDEDYRYTLYEMSCDRDIPGFEDPDGIALPYIVTVESESRTVLAIRRNWKADDPLRRKRVALVKYSFLPGLGFYDWGYLHILAGLAQAG